MMCIVVCLVFATCWLTELSINFLATRYFKKLISEGQKAWLRVGLALCLYVLMALFPPMYMGYTLKAAALINIGIQAYRLDNAYFKRKGGGCFSRLNPLRKK
ncbi:hypothetical protein EAE91_21490 [Photorhabdus noenieputensis]|nr:hypothetical protein [Photorhabdus noenieputensis]